MTPAAYDAWYATPRGRWIGGREFALLARLLGARPGETLLDVDRGTGCFARRFAREAGLKVTGVDRDPAMLALARENAPDLDFVPGDAEHLPFAAASFDHVVAVAACPGSRSAAREATPGRAGTPARMRAPCSPMRA